MKTKIIPSVTSMGGNWESKFKEIKTLKVEEFALFVSCLDKFQRNDCYRKLLKAKNNHKFKIPFVHARSDMHESEFEFLMDNFGTEKFNLHPTREYPLHNKLSKEIRKFIYIENASENMMITREDILGFAGICFDLSHLKDIEVQSDYNYNKLVELTSEFKVGANHISGVGLTKNNGIISSKHYLENSNEINYLSTLNPKAFSEMIAVELENSISEQLSLIPRIRVNIEKAFEEDSLIAA